MYKGKRNFIAILILEVLVLIVQLVLLMREVNLLQGNGRIVNYAGIVRGATQRLVKNELYGKQDDVQIRLLDDIILGLQTGKGSQELNVIKDEEYNNTLSILADEWIQVKIIIYKYRKDPGKKELLYKISEMFFTTADILVTAAEKYYDNIAKKLRILEITISITIFLMLIKLFWEIGREIRKNRILNQIAYIDPQTGLPNKRGCEDKMKEQLLEGSEACCLMFDLNNLKLANDTYGHYVGDILINSFASILRKTMPDDMFIGRFGGDEFVGIQLNANREVIKDKINKLDEVATHTNVGTSRRKIIISFAYGYAYSSEYPSYTLKSLLDVADKEMYKNKLEMKRKRT